LLEVMRMRAHEAIPQEMLRSWKQSQSIPDSAGTQHAAHYHEVDEWLRVETGRMSFTDVISGETIAVERSQVLEIPSGSVHTVRIDSDVRYQMWTPVEPEPPFQRPLSALPNEAGVSDQVLAELVFSTFEMPRLENRIGDGDEQARARLLTLLHPDLQFLRGNGTFATLEQFSSKPAGAGAGVPRVKLTMRRWRSSAFEILQLKPTGALVSIDVHTIDEATSPPSRARTRNLRGFALDAGQWRCRVWMNYALES
jgi:mannose-6-phosphate isomerase-like protein (cupin superfamily)